ncbi:riboflavin synthase [Acidithiobacillus sp. AMEEHan]|uniref:riboflavin synthase n=1 Tax=Acidithiobacillus sp. AMEEHan TaxID=2994951 RepID=UPI0027E3F0FF|nr:riboflavin synthase [Acidithiobacillus sp. AMEEHan]
MFTGIVQALGTLQLRQHLGGDQRFWIAAGSLDLSDVQLGDSIAVSGVCLTAVALDHGRFAVDVSRETLERSTLGNLAPGAQVNLEKALRLADRLGGHLVAGHVDGVGTLLSAQASGRSQVYRVQVPQELRRYIAAKGSICVDGISLTVNALYPDGFALNLIPHSLAQTTAQFWKPGQRLNLEVDLLARYLERLMAENGKSAVESRLDAASLAAKGFS